MEINLSQRYTELKTNSNCNNNNIKKSYKDSKQLFNLNEDESVNNSEYNSGSENSTIEDMNETSLVSKNKSIIDSDESDTSKKNSKNDRDLYSEDDLTAEVAKNTSNAMNSINTISLENLVYNNITDFMKEINQKISVLKY